MADLTLAAILGQLLRLLFRFALLARGRVIMMLGCLLRPIRILYGCDFFDKFEARSQTKSGHSLVELLCWYCCMLALPEVEKSLNQVAHSLI